MEIISSVLFFILAGICEIGGGYLVWLALRGGDPWYYGVFGGLILILYGILPTLQPPSASFGRVYAAYGGIFILLSLLWGWKVDGIAPDLYDIAGSSLALLGAAVIMYAPRG